MFVPGHGRAIRHGVLAFWHSRIGSVWRAVRGRLHRRSGGCIRGRLRLSTTREHEHENDTCTGQQLETGFYHHLTSMRRRLPLLWCRTCVASKRCARRHGKESSVHTETRPARVSGLVLGPRLRRAQRDTCATRHRKNSGSVCKRRRTIEPPPWRSCRLTTRARPQSSVIGSRCLARRGGGASTLARADSMVASSASVTRRRRSVRDVTSPISRTGAGETSGRA
jgi:hypothetical protein